MSVKGTAEEVGEKGEEPAPIYKSDKINLIAVKRPRGSISVPSISPIYLSIYRVTIRRERRRKRRERKTGRMLKQRRRTTKSTGSYR